MPLGQDPEFRLPPEWHRQCAMLLVWPHEESPWLPWLEAIEDVYTVLVRTISLRQQILLLVANYALEERVRDRLRQASVDLARVQFFVVPTNDTWVRDYGPITVVGDEQAMLLDFVFNGWGEKFAADLDNGATRRLYDTAVFGAAGLGSVGIVLEGGSIEVDGNGTLLTTTRCLLSPQRNPYLTREDYEQAFARWFGVQRVAWLQHGYLAGDDTGGHIDTLARFCDPNTIAYTACRNSDDEHYPALSAMEVELTTLRDAQDQRYNLVPLPWPRPQYSTDGQRLPANYTNFAVINDAVLVPTYDDPADPIALERLGACFPDREIVEVHCRPLLEQYGSLHCITMQVPVEACQ